ncbi:MAG: hypothetical protein ABEJ80_03170 [Halarchaeum sp.]
MTSRRRFLAGALASGLAASAGCGAPLIDHAAYSTAGDHVDGLDYAAVRERASAADYGVDGPYYVNGRRRLGVALDVPALVEEFGADARVVTCTFDDGPRHVEADFTVESGVRLAFVDDELDFERAFRPSNLPADGWLAARLGVLFALDADAAADLVGRVKSAAAGTSDHLLTVTVDDPPALGGVHDWFVAHARETTTGPTQGDGWASRRYADDAGSLGAIDVVVPSVRITTTRDGHEYEIKLDALGGFRLLVTLEPGGTIPEADYRGAFREMFETLGLPADRVDDYEFEYSPSNW